MRKGRRKEDDRIERERTEFQRMEALVDTVRQEWRTNKEGLRQPLDPDVLTRVLGTVYRRAHQASGQKGAPGPACILVLDSPQAMKAAVVQMRELLEGERPRDWQSLSARLPGTLYPLSKTPPAELGAASGFFGYLYHGDAMEVGPFCSWIDGPFSTLKNARRLMWGPSSDMVWNAWWHPTRDLQDRLTKDERERQPPYVWTYQSYATVGASVDLAYRAGLLKGQDLGDWLEFMRLPVRDIDLYENVALLCHHPTSMNTDENGRPHSSRGPAMTWSDGAETYCLHGCEVPREIMEHPEKLTVVDVLEESNVEVRRHLIDLVGVERFLKEGHFQVIHHDVDAAGMPRRLLRMAPARDEPVVVVEVTCPSTRKATFLRVPPKTYSCEAAVAWTFGFSCPEEYQPIQET